MFLDETGSPFMKVWLTKDKNQVHVSDMEVSHIQNCIKMLRRFSSEAFDTALQISAYAATAPEMASYYAEHDAEAMFGKVEEAGDWIDVFQGELATRGIDS